jgi:hypothetical protein
MSAKEFIYLTDEEMAGFKRNCLRADVVGTLLACANFLRTQPVSVAMQGAINKQIIEAADNYNAGTKALEATNAK